MKENFYLQGTGLNMFGRPISSEKITIVPVGPKTHLTEFVASVSDLPLPCIRRQYYVITMLRIELQREKEQEVYQPEPTHHAASSSYLLSSFFRNLDPVFS